MYRVYRVMPNDTMEIIANKFGTTKEELERINGLVGSYFLEPYTTIIVPNVGIREVSTYIVKQGDNIYDIARRHDVNYKDVLEINGLKENEYIYPGQEIILPRSLEQTYTTKMGDTLKTIAHNFNTSEEGIIKQNPQIYLKEDQIIKFRKEKNI